MALLTWVSTTVPSKGQDRGTSPPTTDSVETGDICTYTTPAPEKPDMTRTPKIQQSPNHPFQHHPLISRRSRPFHAHKRQIANTVRIAAYESSDKTVRPRRSGLQVSRRVSNEGASRTPRDITGLGQGSVVLSQRAAVVPIEWFAGSHSRGVHGAVSRRAVSGREETGAKVYCPGPVCSMIDA
jgi:hypothetical protein